MMASTLLREQAVDGLRRDVGRGVTGVGVELLDRLAVDATGLVDLLEREVDAGELGRAEERERAGLRQQRADA